jgi:hypothetical protein
VRKRSNSWDDNYPKFPHINTNLYREQSPARVTEFFISWYLPDFRECYTRRSSLRLRKQNVSSSWVRTQLYWVIKNMKNDSKLLSGFPWPINGNSYKNLGSPCCCRWSVTPIKEASGFMLWLRTAWSVGICVPRRVCVTGHVIEVELMTI